MGLGDDGKRGNQDVVSKLSGNHQPLLCRFLRVGAKLGCGLEAGHLGRT